MAVSNRDRVGRGFELLARGLAPYVDRRMRASSRDGKSWFERWAERERGGPYSLEDPHVLLKVMADSWDVAFRNELSRADRNLVFELREFRNRWAHNERFSLEDAYRALDSIERLLHSVDASEAGEVGRSKDELMRQRYPAEAAKVTEGEALVTKPTAGLVPWREVIEPHDDVVQGRFSQAEFAADLHLVSLGQGRQEYTDPAEFFRRTYLTSGLRQLLTQAGRRVTGAGGVPVVDLQTTFGGGKTHSMIALYHLFSGRSLADFPHEVQELLAADGVEELPSVRRAVLVGTKIPPDQPSTKPDGTEVRTLWGELAWQLGGADGFELVARADRSATSPGDALRVLFDQYGPCLVLIDEWVAYARQLYGADGLAAGSFDTHFSFAQALTEAARGSKHSLLVLSLPASAGPDDRARVGSGAEVGGPGGQEALKRLRNVIGRMESAWRPATAEESFEIVRRRLFKAMEPAQLANRDQTAAAFGELYRKQAAEFPAECRELAYVEKIKAAYPIHPELFARLYEDWSALERFQRTRGVLRLMADVVRALWVGGDKSPLITPASVSLDDAAVNSELTHNLDDNWKPIIDADVDGPDSLPVELDRQIQNLGRSQAARRVARTVFLGSAPAVGSPNRGIEAPRIRLGCVLPGESVAVFGDALSRLSGRATYLYADQGRYWYGTKPSVTRVARDRTERLLTTGRDEVTAEIVRRLQPGRDRGDFATVHVAPRTSGDVSDEDAVRLVILGPDHPHISKSQDSSALAAAREFLERRGNSPRQYRNMVVFLAADHRRLEELERAVAEYLAWRSVHDDAGEDRLNLDPHQTRHAAQTAGDAERVVQLRTAETYQWLVLPLQPDPAGPVEWEEFRVDGQGGLAPRASQRLVTEALLYVDFPPVLLRRQLDGPLATLWEEGHVSLRELWDTFARYCYLPRLRSIEVLQRAVRDAPARITWEQEGFAVADGHEDGRYQGLVLGGFATTVTPTTLVVRPEAALAQVDTEAETTPVPGGPAQLATGVSGAVEEATKHLARRFYGVVDLPPERLVRDFGKVAQEVVQHLASLVGTQLQMTLEVRASNPDGFPDQVVRIVSENANTLRFSTYEFEEE